VFLIAGVAGFYYLRDSAMVLRFTSVLAGVVAAAAMAAFTDMGREFIGFGRESVDETKKVVWPNRKETLQTTGVVFAFVVVMAIFLWLVDTGLLLAVKALVGKGE